MDVIPYLAALSGIAALVLAFFYYKSVEAASPGVEFMESFMCKN